MELLAPAGNYESFLGAVNAGADAVYLGGEKFGARAYADNFTREEICRAIRYAHLFDRKVYLTVNTLIKDSEFPELIPYLEPFYQVGLDGVIVQDIGAFLAIREAFPDLKLHVSTQMTVTGSYAAAMLKEMGAVRIVPARELSLAEIRSMKEEVGLELETFIHGAMCYCYSGQCLFSSILGGRSGNRGRCAQPCRLPYRAEGIIRKEEAYPLSLKDMCSITFLPRLIEAGIDSFKIEGRMKKPEYAAGVTAIYRKYIDRYYEKGSKGYKVEQADMDKLSSLYIRSGIQDGYYFKHNGADMVTIASPAYNGSDEKLLADIHRRYIEHPLKKEIYMRAEFLVGKEAILTMISEDTTVTVSGDMVQPAVKQPVTEENIKSGLLKLGNTFFTATEENIALSLDEGAFYSLKALNELRRLCVQRLEDALCSKDSKTIVIDEKVLCSNNSEEKQTKTVGCVRQAEKAADVEKQQTKTDIGANKSVHISVNTTEQLEALHQCGFVPDILYLDSELAEMTPALIQEIKDLFVQRAKTSFPQETTTPAIYIALPYIVRKKDISYLGKLLPALEAADGVLVRNAESHSWLTSQGYTGKIHTDAGIYNFNRRTLQFWKERADLCCLPYELNRKESRSFLDAGGVEQIVYGYIPLMLTANCVAKTMGNCHKDSENGRNMLSLTDRYHRKFPVETRCRQCYNIIYNTIPLSLHEKGRKLLNYPIRIQFTVENAKETKRVLLFWTDVLQGRKTAPPYEEYTLGHEKRGVE